MPTDRASGHWKELLKTNVARIPVGFGCVEDIYINRPGGPGGSPGEFLN